jgi:hypothetical protein
MAKNYIRVKDGVVDFFKSLVSKDFRDNDLMPPKKDERSPLAKKIDYLTIRVLVFFVLAFFMSLKLSLSWTLIFAAGGTFLLHFALRRAERARERRYSEDMRNYSVRTYTYEQIMKMEPSTEFNILMAQVLNRLNGFTEIQPCSDGSLYYKFDLVGKFKDYPIAVRCNRYKKENEVGKEELSRFASDLKKAGLKRGIFLTTSNFSEWAIDYVNSIRDELRIVLVDKVKLLEWIRLSGHSIYPDAQKAEELEAEKRERERMVSLQKREKQNKRLMQAFFLVSVYLTVLSLLMRHWLQDWMLYLYFIAALVNMLLGLVCYGIFKHTRSVIRESYMLEHLD